MLLNKVTLTPSRFIFVRREYTKQAEGKHKLQPIADGPFQIITSDVTIVTVRIGNKVQKISRDRMVEASITTEDVPLRTSGMRQKFNPTPTHPIAQSASRRILTQEHVIYRIISDANDADDDTLYQVQ